MNLSKPVNIQCFEDNLDKILREYFKDKVRDNVGMLEFYVDAPKNKVIAKLIIKSEQECREDLGIK